MTRMRLRLRRAVARALYRFIISKWVQTLLRNVKSDDNLSSVYDRRAGEDVAIYESSEPQSSKRPAIMEGTPTVARFRDIVDRRAWFLATELFQPLGLDRARLLEVGAGEFTTLVPLARELGRPGPGVFAVDLSWSRLAVGRQFAERNGVRPEAVVVGTGVRLPFATGSFDVVMTNHCLEQISFQTGDMLRELRRVCRRYLMLVEPSYELGDRIQRRHMRDHQFNTTVFREIRKLGWPLCRHELLPFDVDAHNRSALHLIKFEGPDQPPPMDVLACPICRGSLWHDGDVYFCRACSIAFPVLASIPLLSKAHGIPATKYPDFAEFRQARPGQTKPSG